jgi:hypothetical protein
MQRHKYQICMTNPSREIFVVIDCIGPNDGQVLLESQYNCQVIWCGAV